MRGADGGPGRRICALPAFWVGLLYDDAALAAITIQPEEIAEYRLIELDAALPMLRPPIRRRVRAASRHRKLVYLEDGRAVPGVS